MSDPIDRDAEKQGYSDCLAGLKQRYPDNDDYMAGWFDALNDIKEMEL